MNYRSIFILTALLAGAFVFAAPRSVSASENIAVYELFTALGCGDTVPADKVFEKFAGANHQNLIALSCHVTFFDGRLPDPDGQTFCDYRHTQYSETVLSGAGAPQAIINGRFDTKGDNENIIRDALAMAHSLDSIEPIQLTLSERDLSITLPQMRFDRPVDVWLFAYKKRGEVKNLDNLLDGTPHPYLNIATHGKKLLEWDGAYRNLNVDLTLFPAEGYVVLAQYADHTDIIAAGKIEKVEKETTPPSPDPDQE